MKIYLHNETIDLNMHRNILIHYQNKKERKLNFNKVLKQINRNSNIEFLLYTDYIKKISYQEILAISNILRKAALRRDALIKVRKPIENLRRIVLLIDPFDQVFINAFNNINLDLYTNNYFSKIISNIEIIASLETSININLIFGSKLNSLYIEDYYFIYSFFKQINIYKDYDIYGPF